MRERLAAFPALTARRLFREIKERGFSGGYSVVRDRVRDIRPARSAGYEVRFETLRVQIGPAAQKATAWDEAGPI